MGESVRSVEERAALERQVEQIRWFHRIDLGGGIVTPGADNPGRKLERLGLPSDLTGKAVLDIGAWDGFFSFEAERRGAERVVALDHVAWSDPVVHELGWRTGRAGFDLARSALRSKVEAVDCDLYDIGPDLGNFDVVLLLGVLYHLRDPVAGLERVASVTKDLLVVNTHTDLWHVKRPAAAFYGQRELGDDPTNWWGPNIPAVCEMLRAVGFSDVRVVWPRSAAHRAAGIAFRAAKGARDRLTGSPWGARGAWAYGQVTVHARK